MIIKINCKDLLSIQVTNSKGEVVPNVSISDVLSSDYVIEIEMIERGTLTYDRMNEVMKERGYSVGYYKND